MNKALISTLAAILCAVGPLSVWANCPDPIQLKTTVQHSVCGKAQGAITLELSGAASDYSIAWTPNVSGSLKAENLGAGAYRLKISRLNQPDCSLDTIIIVNNTDGPAFEATAVEPAACLAANGKISLSPAGLSYTWSDGKTGASNATLPAGCYAVTASDAANGCYSVAQVCVPASNPLVSSVEILKPAKCGKATGRVEVKVQGGSGQYGFSLGGPIVGSLAAGNHTEVISDLSNGCRDTVSWTIPSASVAAQVNIKVNPARCSDGIGNADISVAPGAYFELPFSFQLTHASGAAASPGQLAPGVYQLIVSDADNCPLPPQNFEVKKARPIEVLADVQAATCGQGGAIQLITSGGQPPLFTDWKDLRGSINPRNRSNLAPGAYKAVVFDSLFCADSVELDVKTLCNRSLQLGMLVQTGASNTICIPTPQGYTASDMQFSLLDKPGNTGSSPLGVWALNAQGCLNYFANNTTGFNKDKVCILVRQPQLGIFDTVCVSVSIVSAATSYETVYSTTQVDKGSLACGNIPADLDPTLVLALNVAGLSGRRPFGTYQLNPGTGCLRFKAFDATDFFVDSLSFAFCDTLRKRCHVVSFVPSVLPYADCSKGILPDNRLEVFNPVCRTPTPVCLPVPYGDILNYDIFDNERPYKNGYIACAEGSELRFDAGAHLLMMKRIQTGCLDTLDLSVTCVDCKPVHSYSVDKNDNVYIETYACDTDTLFCTDILVSDIKHYTVTDRFRPVGPFVVCGDRIALALDTSLHEIRIRNNSTTCSYFFRVKVDCSKAPPPGEKLVVYNGISPNGDGRNDVWRIGGIEQYPDNEVWVFNRWGAAVFSQKNYRNDQAWDGRWNGSDLPDGAYYYVIDLKDGSKPLSGYIQLMR